LAIDKKCVTSKTCDDADIRKSFVTQNWEVFWRPRALGNSPAPSRPAPAPRPSPSTPSPRPTEDRFCRDECPTRKQNWSTKCKWNKCKKCPACS
jgi:hypothetical protein